MGTPADKANTGAAPTTPGFSPLKIIVPVLLALLAISTMAQWYARHVSLPRYCAQPDITVQNLERLLDETPKIDDAQRRGYMVAAKILFLHPREDSENKADYLARVRLLISSECR